MTKKQMTETPKGIPETALLNEEALTEDWSRPGEDEAWSLTFERIYI